MSTELTHDDGYLPEREELRREIERTLRISEEEGRERQDASGRSERDPPAASPAASALPLTGL